MHFYGIIALCGLMVSTFGTVVGFGGGIFMVPILVLAFGIPIHLAVGAVVISLFPSALISSFFNYRAKLIDVRTAAALEFPTILGALLGAYLTSKLSVHLLEYIFAGFLMIVGLQLYFKKSGTNSEGTILRKLNVWGPQVNSAQSTYRVGVLSSLGFGGLSGLFAGLFGVGGGFMKTPLMIHVFKIPAPVAVATALFMIVFTSLAASITHYRLGHVQPELTLAVVSGFIVGPFLGQYFKKKISPIETERLIAFALFLAGLVVGIHAAFIS